MSRFRKSLKIAYVTVALKQAKWSICITNILVLPKYRSRHLQNSNENLCETHPLDLSKRWLTSTASLEVDQAVAQVVQIDLHSQDHWAKHQASKKISHEAWIISFKNIQNNHFISLRRERQREKEKLTHE